MKRREIIIGSVATTALLWLSKLGIAKKPETWKDVAARFGFKGYCSEVWIHADGTTQCYNTYMAYYWDLGGHKAYFQVPLINGIEQNECHLLEQGVGSEKFDKPSKLLVRLNEIQRNKGALYVSTGKVYAGYTEEIQKNGISYQYNLQIGRVRHLS